MSFMDGLRPIIVIGIVFGIFPRFDLITKWKPSKGIHMTLLVFSGISFVFLCVNGILKLYWFLKHHQSFGVTFIDKLKLLTGVTFNLGFSSVYCYHILHPKRFPQIIKKLNSIVKLTNLEGCTPSFQRFCWIVTVSCMAAGILENLLYDNQVLFDSTFTNKTVLSSYFISCCDHWRNVIPASNSFIVITFYILVKMGKWAWLLMDAVVIILCHAMAKQFQVLNIEMKRHLNANFDSKSKNHVGVVFAITGEKRENRIETLHYTWEKAFKKFRKLTELTEQIEEYVAPMIYACYFCIGQILMIIFGWMGNFAVSKNANGTALRGRYEQTQLYFSSIYYIWRVGIVTYYATEVNYESGKILGTVERCPTSDYSVSVQRLQRKLTGNPVGIRLFGSFLMSRNFIMSIGSFIVTTEIVLLQMALANI